MATNKKFKKKQEEKTFLRTFELLQDKLSDSAFKRYNVERRKFQGGFAISQFEVVACGIGFNIAHGIEPENILRKVSSLANNKIFREWSGSGITASRRLPKLIPLGRRLFAT